MIRWKSHIQHCYYHLCMYSKNKAAMLGKKQIYRQNCIKANNSLICGIKATIDRSLAHATASNIERKTAPHSCIRNFILHAGDIREAKHEYHRR